jgi:hypothetical protein
LAECLELQRTLADSDEYTAMNRLACRTVTGPL